MARFEGGFIPETFHGLQFLFSGDSFGQYIFELFACETNLKKMRRQCGSEVEVGKSFG